MSHSSRQATCPPQRSSRLAASYQTQPSQSRFFYRLKRAYIKEKTTFKTNETIDLSIIVIQACSLKIDSINVDEAITHVKQLLEAEQDLSPALKSAPLRQWSLYLRKNYLSLRCDSISLGNTLSSYKKLKKSRLQIPIFRGAP